MNEYDASDILLASEEIADAKTVQASLDRLGREISEVLHDSFPLVLPVMGGAIVFAGQLLPRLGFPLEFDYLHVTRYRGKTQGGAIEWCVLPGKSVAGRTLLVVDDILDEGETLYAVRQRLLEMGAGRVLTAVLADKDIQGKKPVKADFWPKSAQPFRLWLRHGCLWPVAQFAGNTGFERRIARGAHRCWESLAVPA